MLCILSECEHNGKFELFLMKNFKSSKRLSVRDCFFIDTKKRRKRTVPAQHLSRNARSRRNNPFQNHQEQHSHFAHHTHQDSGMPNESAGSTANSRRLFSLIWATSSMEPIGSVPLSPPDLFLFFAFPVAPASELDMVSVSCLWRLCPCWLEPLQ